jgi:hypothetical protein
MRSHLDEHEQCAFAVFDADRADGLVRLAELAMELAAQGLPTILEASRRGGHLWVHMAEPTPAALVRSTLIRINQSNTCSERCHARDVRRRFGCASTCATRCAVLSSLPEARHSWRGR